MFQKCSLRVVLCLTSLLAVASAKTHAQVLYDGSLGSFPEAQGWSYAGLDFGVIKMISGDSVLLDTTSTDANQVGWGRVAVPPLDRTMGFSLIFTCRLNAETHSSTNRAGFSIIVLGSDTNGIELAFWTDRVFAQSGPPSLFTHAEDALIDTTSGFVEYALTLLTTNYVLRANGPPILTGPIRDYTSFSGPINPYRTPNFLFFGDDTTSARASVNVKNMILARAPVISINDSGVINWSGISNLTYRVEASTNLVEWVEVGSASSTTDSFSFTNALSGSHEFLRVAHP